MLALIHERPRRGILGSSSAGFCMISLNTPPGEPRGLRLLHLVVGYFYFYSQTLGARAQQRQSIIPPLRNRVGV
jgi:hypothetical protein